MTYVTASDLDRYGFKLMCGKCNSPEVGIQIESYNDPGDGWYGPHIESQLFISCDSCKHSTTIGDTY